MPGPRHRADADQRLADPIGHLARAAQRRSERRATISAGTVARSSSASASSCARGRQRPRDPLMIGRRHRHRVRRGVEQHGRDVDARDAVDERVMGLRQQREAVVGQALHQPQLPQRPAAIQCLREHAAREALQLVVAAGTRQRRVPDVVGDLEVRIVDPHRPTLVQRHECQPLAVAGHQVQPRDDRLDQLLVRRVRRPRTPCIPRRACVRRRARDAETSCRGRSAGRDSPRSGFLQGRRGDGH